MVLGDRRGSQQSGRAPSPQLEERSRRHPHKTPQDIKVVNKDRDVVLVTAAPPCPDYSRIQLDAAGRHGPSGNLSVEFTKFLEVLEGLLPGYKVALGGECAHELWGRHSVLLQGHARVPILADSADYGIIGRPRLWWTRTTGQTSASIQARRGMCAGRSNA